MPFIPELDLDAASASQRAAFEEEMRLRGRMTNMKRTLLHSPVALRIYGEWFTLRDELAPAIGDRAVLTLCLAISTAMNSRVGIAFMRRGLAELKEESTPTDSVELEDIEAFGTAFAVDAKAIPAALWARLSEKLTSKTLVDLTALAGIMVATISFMDAVDTEPDPELSNRPDR